MGTKNEDDYFTFTFAPWLERLIRKDFESGNVIHFPNSWVKKLVRVATRYGLWQVASIIMKLSWESADGTVMLPVKLSEENVDRTVMLPKNRQLLEQSKRFKVPYDGLGSRSTWRRTLLDLERHKMISIAWRKDFALVTPILTKLERKGRFSG